MLHDPVVGGASLFASVFSDAPVPDIEAAIVVAHPGDEAMSASWVLVRLQKRASVYCLTRHGAARTDGTVAAAAVAGVPADRCHNLGLTSEDLARDLETLVWLTIAAVTGQPRVLVTHCCEGKSLARDATAFAVYMTATLLMRSGMAAPVVVEIPTPGVTRSAGEEALLLPVRQVVRIQFGPESRKMKRRMLRCHAAELQAPVETVTLSSEDYIFASSTNPLDNLVHASGPYADAPGCHVEDFRRHARHVATQLSLAVLSTPSRA
jgi:hypothetical protein